MHLPQPTTVGHIISENARRSPDRTAIVFDGRRVGFSEFAERAKRLASALEQRGMRRQDRIAVMAMNCVEFLEAYGACELTGFIAATVNWRLAAPEVAWITQDAAPRCLIFEAQYASLIDRIRSQLASVERYVCIGGGVPWAEDYEAVVASGSPSGPTQVSRPEDIAYLIYTSGTTGRPKGCMLGHAEVVFLAQQLGSELGVTPGDRELIVMPLFHVGAKWMQLAFHLRAAPAVLQRQFDPASIPRLVERERITLLHVAPTMFQALIEHPAVRQHDLSTLDTILYAAAPMPSKLLEAGIAMFGEIFVQQWGQTEGCGTTLHRHHHKLDGTARERVRLTSIGQPNWGTEIRIVDEAGNDCPVGMAGEIAYRTAGMFRGYWNNSAATLETLVDGWCRSGDLGRTDEEGFVYLVDRKKDMIISGGENIYSREVEEAVVTHPAVSEVAVIGVPDEKWGEAVCAVVVLRGKCTASADEIIEHCKASIASYKKPKRVVFVDVLPKLPSGKISKNELRKKYEGNEDPT